jgi:hypothetical protein
VAILRISKGTRPHFTYPYPLRAERCEARPPLRDIASRPCILPVSHVPAPNQPTREDVLVSHISSRLTRQKLCRDILPLRWASHVAGTGRLLPPPQVVAEEPRWMASGSRTSSRMRRCLELPPSWTAAAARSLPGGNKTQECAAAIAQLSHSPWAEKRVWQYPAMTQSTPP